MPFAAALVVERFDNTHHQHVWTREPRYGTWPSVLALRDALVAQYGTCVSGYYRDLKWPATLVGWVFQQAGPDGTVYETWVSVLHPETLKYLPLGQGDDDGP